MREAMRKSVLTAVAAAAIAACSERPEIYDTRVGAVQSFGLVGAAALVDENAHRVVLLTAAQGQELERTFLPVGRGIVRAHRSDDGERLFVLSTGDVVRKKDHDEKPSLTVIEGGGAQRFALESPHSGMSIDALGRWVALFAAPEAGAQSAFVENPNEIILVDLSAPADSAVTPRTIRSFGGKPQRVSFTPVLALPGGARRLLVVETEADVTLLDLDNLRATPARPEITVRLASGASTVVNSPAGVVFDDGDPAKTDDARVGVRLAGSSNVVTLTLAAQLAGAKAEDPAMAPNDFRPLVNLTDVGGAPGDIAFVRTDAGLRLAAVVPSTRRAVLVDPTTSITTNVELSEPFSKLSLITGLVGGATGTDTALLYGPGSARGVAFWSLGLATGQAYRSVEIVALATAIDRVDDVPPPRPQLKVLSSSGASTFYVLDLASRTAAPLVTLSTPTLHVARDGQRIWVYQQGSSELAAVGLSDLHPLALPLDRTIDAVFDVARGGGGRALIAIDARGAFGATVLDALSPDTAAARSYYGLLLEGLQ
jgi:hypothetical protein